MCLQRHPILYGIYIVKKKKNLILSERRMSSAVLGNETMILR